MPPSALFEPELAPDFGASVEVVEPVGVPLDHRRIDRAVIDVIGRGRWQGRGDFALFELRRGVSSC